MFAPVIKLVWSAFEYEELKRRKILNAIHALFKPFPAFCGNCHLLSLFYYISVCTLVDFIANNMDPDQNAPSGAV